MKSNSNDMRVTIGAEFQEHLNVLKTVGEIPCVYTNNPGIRTITKLLTNPAGHISHPESSAERRSTGKWSEQSVFSPSSHFGATTTTSPWGYRR